MYLRKATNRNLECILLTYRLRDWRVERTPINTPDSDLTSKLPHRAGVDHAGYDDYEDDEDDEEDDDIEDEDVHDSLSLNSETDLGSRCSGMTN
jgi:hypothetical protein